MTKHDGWDQFLTLCTELNTKNDLEQLFSLLMTFEERKAISGRYLIVRDLLAGKKTQREMADDLGLSIAKITRGSNSLKEADPKFKARLKTKVK